MCGIVGVIPKWGSGLSKNEFEIFKEMWFANQLRGTDGAGLFCNSKSKSLDNILIYKAPQPASFLLSTSDMEKEISPIITKESNFLIGHNRAATRGEKTTECTHPFIEENIVLVHNGTLFSHKSLHKDLVVDSHAICHSMATIGEKETIEKINGSFALVWVNKKEGTLNLCRNIQRPLFLISTHSLFVISSELGLAQWILQRKGIQEVSHEVVEPYQKYSFTFKKEKQTTYTKTKMEEYRDTNTYQYPRPSYNRSAWKEEYSLGEFIRFKTSPTIISHKKGRYHILGDINKYQHQAASTVAEIDFPNEWKVKIYGKQYELESFKGKNDLIGEITQIIKKDNITTYTVARVGQYYQNKKYVKEDNGEKNLPVPVKSNVYELKRCRMCDAKLNHYELEEGNDLCFTCASTESNYYGMMN